MISITCDPELVSPIGTLEKTRPTSVRALSLAKVGWVVLEWLRHPIPDLNGQRYLPRRGNRPERASPDRIVMDPLNLCIALGPVAIYLILIGSLNLGRRPFVTTGTRDLMALAIAISGFILIGPIQLFLPQAAADYFGGWIWIPLILLYLFCAVLVSMLARPRLVVYNITPEHLRPLLENVVSGLDPHRRWAGSTLASPGLGLQLNIECLPRMRNVQLVAVGSEQDLERLAAA